MVAEGVTTGSEVGRARDSGDARWLVERLFVDPVESFPAV